MPSNLSHSTQPTTKRQRQSRDDSSATPPGRPDQSDPAGQRGNRKAAESYVNLGPSAHGVWHELGRDDAGFDAGRASVAFVNVHPWVDSTGGRINSDLAHRGYRVFSTDHHSTWMSVSPAVGRRCVHLHDLLAPVETAVARAHNRPEVETVLLLGHSAGAQLVALYQNVAENGVDVGQGKEKLLPLPEGLRKHKFPPADGIFIMDGHLGDGAKGLTDLGPQVVDSTAPQRRDPDVDMLDPNNGYAPESGNASSYSTGFLDRFFSAQADRMRTLIDSNQESLKAISAGSGRFPDDDDFILVDARSRVWRPDPSILSHTDSVWPLVRPETGESSGVKESVQQIDSVRGVKAPDYEPPITYAGDEVEPMSVRRFLSTRAVRPRSTYRLTASSIEGIAWNSSNATTPGNLQGISTPLLIVHMTGHYFVVHGELFWNHAGSTDRTLKYIHGANHFGDPIDPKYGDTRTALIDVIDEWTTERYVS